MQSNSWSYAEAYHLLRALDAQPLHRWHECLWEHLIKKYKYYGIAWRFLSSGMRLLSSSRSLSRFGGTCFFRLQNPFHFLSILKMEASNFSEMSETIYQDKHGHSCENFKSRTGTSYGTMTKGGYDRLCVGMLMRSRLLARTDKTAAWSDGHWATLFIS
jgi:hypothetical protein